MLNIDLEFRYGMLFVRLNGVLNQNTCSKLSNCLENMIYNNGLKYFVINLGGLTSVDDRGLKEIINKYFDIKLNDGNLVICGYNEKVNNKHNIEIEDIFNQIKHTNNELNAFKILSI